MRKRAARALLFVFAITFLALVYNNCGKFKTIETAELESSSTVGPNVVNQTLKGSDIITRKCESCHNADANLGGPTNLDRDALVKAGWIIPGQATNSSLYQALVQKRMPKSGDYLDEVELALVRDWIDGKTSVSFNDQLKCNQTAADLAQPKVARLWPITANQYANMMLDIFGLTEDYYSSLPAKIEIEGLGNQTRHLTVDHYFVYETGRIADLISSRIAGDDVVLQKFWTCATSLSSVSATCVDQFVNRAGLYLFRRPLEADELTRYKAIYQSAGNQTQAVRQGAKLVLQTMLTSPLFLYRKEYGTSTGSGVRDLSNDQIAEWLSFTFLDSTPDAELFQLAANGTLKQPAVRQAQIERLMKTERGARVMGRFLADLMDVDRINTLPIPVADSSAFAKSAMEEFQLFIANSMNSQNTLKEILSGRKSFIDSQLATESYGMSGFNANQFTPIDLPAERGGILTLPAFVVSTAGLAGGKSFLKRGVIVRERLLCQKLGTPPADAANAAALPKPANYDTLTPREQFEALHLRPTCVGCHSQIDPIGFGMEEFTKAGKFNRVADVHGFVSFTAKSDFSFNGTRELGEGLAESDEVRDCLTMKLVEYINGDHRTVSDQCEVQRAQNVMAAKSTNFKQGLLQILNDASNFRRQGE